MKRIRISDIYRVMGRANRQDFDRGIERQYLGTVGAEEYGRTFQWTCWTYRTPRTRETVCVLARRTASGNLRVVHTRGILAYQIKKQSQKTNRKGVK